MKVMHILSTNTFSGAENVVCQIIELYKNDAIQMVYTAPNGNIEKTLKEKEIPFLGMKKFSFKEVKKAIQTFQPTIIHAHDVKASVFSSFASKNIPVISHIHGNSEKMRVFSLKSWLYKVASKKIKHIFWVSDSSLQSYYFKSAVEKKSSVLRNIVNPTEIEKKAEMKDTKSYDIVFLGRLIPLKNPIRLLHIFEIIEKVRPKTTFALIGDGVLRPKIEKYIQNKNNIVLLGYQDNPYPYLKRAKVMLMASVLEGTPMCALEANALSIPIVATPTDGLVELVKQNETGFLSDDDALLAQFILKLLEEENFYKNVQKNIKREFTKQNNRAKYKEQLDKIYKD